jgi:hypothetical protein
MVSMKTNEVEIVQVAELFGDRDKFWQLQNLVEGKWYLL